MHNQSTHHLAVVCMHDECMSAAAHTRASHKHIDLSPIPNHLVHRNVMLLAASIWSFTCTQQVQAACKAVRNVVEEVRKEVQMLLK